jgi:hypothetical protein
MNKFALLRLENNANLVIEEGEFASFQDAVTHFNGHPGVPLLNCAGYAVSQLLVGVSYVVAQVGLHGNYINS